MECVASPKKLISTLFFDVETLVKREFDRLVASSRKQRVPLTYGQTMNLHGMDAPFELLDTGMDDTIHLGEIGIEAIGEQRNHKENGFDCL